MSRVLRAFLAVGLLVAILGVAVGAYLQDRYVGLILVIIGAFLIILPLSRPHVDEDE